MHRELGWLPVALRLKAVFRCGLALELSAIDVYILGYAIGAGLARDRVQQISPKRFRVKPSATWYVHSSPVCGWTTPQWFWTIPSGRFSMLIREDAISGTGQHLNFRPADRLQGLVNSQIFSDMPLRKS
jgi:hypothetical protein